MSAPIRVAVLTVSDRCSAGATVDTSGPALCALATRKLGAQVVAQACVPDDAAAISRRLRAWARGRIKPDLILTTGGTGLAPRDVTPEATLRVLERQAPGLMELVRLRTMAKTARTFLSRGVAGTLGRSLIVNLPGSERGATECFEALLDLLPHAVELMRGTVKDDGRPRSR